MVCLSLIDPYPFDGHPLKVGMVSWVSKKIGTNLIIIMRAKI